MNYSHVGQKFGITLKDEVINSIQSKLEKKVTAYICRYSKRIAPIEAKLFAIQSNIQANDAPVSNPENECDKIIDARAAAVRSKSAKMRQREIEEAMKTYKKYQTFLDAYVKKCERKCDWQFRQFLLGAAKCNNSRGYSEPIRFKSQAFKEFTEKIREEICDYEI